MQAASVNKAMSAAVLAAVVYDLATYPGWRGRRLNFDRYAAEASQRRQRSADRAIAAGNGRVQSVADLEALAALDPDEEYERHRENYVKSGSHAELALMLEWVR